jgi:hypothetical protein
MWLKTRTHGGSMTDRLFMDQSQTVFNETGANTDFRVETNNNANTLFIDGGDDIVSIGNDSPRGTAFYHGNQDARLQMEGLSFKEASFAQVINSTSNYSSHVLARSRGTALDSNTVLQANDYVGEVSFQGSDGTNFIHGASMYGRVEAGVGANDMPMYIGFATNAGGTGTTERMKIDSAGDVTISDGNLVVGTAGHGIDFSAQTATSASGAGTTAELLDHYETGTWTPVFTVASGSITTGTNVGRFVRVGDMIHCAFNIRSTGVSSPSGAVQISGLPFAAHSPSRSAGSLWFMRSWGGALNQLRFGVAANDTELTFYTQEANATVSQLLDTDLSTGSDDNVMEASIVYRVA